MSGRIVMRIMDKDLVKDEVVGSLLFNLKDCIGSLNGKFSGKISMEPLLAKVEKTLT